MNRLATLELDRFRQRVTLMVRGRPIGAPRRLRLEDRRSRALAGRAPVQRVGSDALRPSGGARDRGCELAARVRAADQAGRGRSGARARRLARQSRQPPLVGDLGGSPDFIRFTDGSTGNVADLSIAAGACSCWSARSPGSPSTTFVTARNQGRLRVRARARARRRRARAPRRAEARPGGASGAAAARRRP